MMRLFLPAVLTFGLSLPTMAQDQGRAITGTLIYPERIALPSGSEVLVSVEGAFGSTLGETLFVTEGEQVPLAFALDVPARLQGRVNALIRVDGQPSWIAQDLRLAAGTEAADLGEIRLARITPLAFATSFDCGGTALSFGILEDKATLRVGTRDFEMQAAVAASGARYVAVGDDSTEFWSRGDRATVTVEGQVLAECVETVAETGPYRARGNEPGWSVTLNETEIEIVADYGALTRSAPRPAVQITPGAYMFDMPGITARLTLEDRLCADDATGMPYPHHAILDLDDRRLAGCGGDPASLLTGVDWKIATVAEETVAEGSEAMLTFGADGRVWGSTGCNRFMGGYDLTGEGLGLGQMGVTMMACSEDLMTQERAVLDALAAVRRFDLSEDGTLMLIGGEEDAALLSATRD